MKVLERAREIGPAVWLFLLYQVNSELCGDPTWALVGNGNAVTDAEAAGLLKVSVYTVTRWRHRLERASMVKAERCRGGGFKMWVRHSETPTQELPNRELNADQWPKMPTAVLQ
jgi:hypothetical protein